MNIKDLDLHPFPSHLSLDDLYRCVSGKPEGTWFIKSTSKEMRVFVIEPEEGLKDYSLESIMKAKNLFKMFSQKLQLSFDKEILQKTPQPITDTKSILDFFSDFSLNDEDRALIKRQIETTQIYLFYALDELRERARLSKKPIYIRPCMMGSGLGKISGVKRKAKYNAAHVQVSCKGKVDFIPKHPRLFLGSGDFKSVRAGVELSVNNRPIRIAAFCSIHFNNRTEHKNIFYEYWLIRRGLKKRKAENTFNVRLLKYTSKRKPHKAKLVLPYANLGDVKKRNFSSDELPQVLIEAARCVKFYHKDGVMIRDIKPENFLVHRDNNRNIQIYNFDLGLGTRRADGRVEKIRGAVLFHSPEIFNQRASHNRSYDGFKADIFALGLSLYEVKTSLLPDFHNLLMHKYFSENNFGALKDIIAMKQIQVDYRNGWLNFKPSENFGKLIKKMIHPNPIFRPDMGMVVENLEFIFNNFTLVQKAEVKDGKLYVKESEEPLHDALNENHLFAFDHEGVLYVKKKFTTFKNTVGILPKCDIVAAGEFHVNNGVIKAVSNKTEPYSFSEKVFSKGLQMLTGSLSYSEIILINRVIKGRYIADPRSIEKIVKDAK